MLRWSKPFGGPYNFLKLIDHRQSHFGAMFGEHPDKQIICDIDKTYLETQFESVVQMVKIAFEDAREKITVRGARDVLMAARWGVAEGARLHAQSKPVPLHFVSSSPPQLRAVLEEKLALDGLDWTSNTFKNQAYNLRKGRMDQLKQHIPYKSAAILQVLRRAPHGAHFYLFGDNAELDAYIYVGLKLLVEGRLGKEDFGRYLRLAGVEEALAKDFQTKLAEVPQVRICSILIRNAPGYRFMAEAPLTDVVSLFDSYFEAALILIRDGLISPHELKALTRIFHNQHGLSRQFLLDTMAAFRQATVSDPFQEALRSAMAWLAEAPGIEPLRLPQAGPMERWRPPRSLDGLSTDTLLHHAEIWAKAITAKKRDTAR